MADNTPSLPPQNLNGIARPSRGAVVVKPKNMKATLRRLWDLTKGHRNGLGPIFLLSALVSVSSILSPYIIGKVVTAISKDDVVTVILISLAALYLFEWLIKFLLQYLMATVGQRIIHYIRRVLFDKIKTLPLSFFDQHQHGELMSRLTNDIDNISTTISNSLTMLLTYFFTIVGIFIMMMRLSPLLTLVSFFGIGLIFLLTKIITSHTKKLFLAQQKNLGGLNGQVEESISGLMVVKAFGQEENITKDFDEKNEQLCKVAIRALIWSGFLMPLMNVINNLCYVAIAVFSGLLFVNGYISDIGLITSFLLYIRQFTRPFIEIANIYNSFQTAVAGAERVFEILDEQPEPEDVENALSLQSPKGDIEFRNVSFGYQPEKMILRNINLKIPAGTKVAIVGPTGSGKTTIINLLTRFYDVNEGEILLDGHDLRSYKMKDLRNAFGVVLQDTALFAEPVRDNISFGCENASLEDIRSAAELAGADSFIHRLPEGYDTVLEQGGAELSQGERQLLTIARAFFSDSPILILDEATSSVDTVTEQKIRHALLKICEGRTSFIIAHRLSTIENADIILVMKDGKIIEKGNHKELLKEHGFYSQLYQSQFQN